MYNDNSMLGFKNLRLSLHSVLGADDSTSMTRSLILLLILKHCNYAGMAHAGARQAHLLTEASYSFSH